MTKANWIMSTDNSKMEVWMRGPVEGVPALLQPVAHALLQVQEEAARYMEGFSEGQLWTKPGGMASAGFHLRHIAGVIDRLFTYARGESLSEEQFAYLRSEGENGNGTDTAGLVRALSEQVTRAVQQLRETEESQLTAPRYLGRKCIPTTTIGLLFHAAEHAQRHIGQLQVTARWVG